MLYTMLGLSLAITHHAAMHMAINTLALCLTTDQGHAEAKWVVHLMPLLAS